MPECKDEQWEVRALELVERHWKWIVVAAWLVFCGWYIFTKWAQIHAFGLGDTDDNMRIMQVRGLLHGQGWYDLRQYRMNPPTGANIHWSRLVDLPIAGLILGLRPFLGGPKAELWAVAIAPLLPYLLLMLSLALTARRLIDPRAWPLALLALVFAGSTNGMFMPERIDHHGWQLALLALSVSAIADPKRVRGGLILGISSALSLAIGLEMIIYLALAGSAMVLFWVDDRAERERLRAYAVALSGTAALGFLLFASYDNRGAVCDALSPVWLSDALLAGALMYALAWAPAQDWKRRLVLAIAAGAAIAAFHAVAWPHCIQRLEGVSPEVEQLWLSHVKEARPVYRHGWRTATAILAAICEPVLRPLRRVLQQQPGESRLHALRPLGPAPTVGSGLTPTCLFDDIPRDSPDRPSTHGFRTHAPSTPTRAHAGGTRRHPLADGAATGRARGGCAGCVRGTADRG